MDFYDVIGRCGEGTIETRRVFEPTFAELLIRNEHVDKWREGCEGFLGAPLDGEDKDEAKRIKAISKDYGGIRPGQTLYLKDEHGARLVVMFWPWLKGEYTTIRMGLSDIDTKPKKQPPAEHQKTPETTPQKKPDATASRVVSIGSHFNRGIGIRSRPTAAEPTCNGNEARISLLEEEVWELKSAVEKLTKQLESQESSG